MIDSKGAPLNLSLDVSGQTLKEVQDWAQEAFSTFFGNTVELDEISLDLTGESDGPDPTSTKWFGTASVERWVPRI